MGNKYIYTIWADPDYCSDGCCSWVVGHYSVKDRADCRAVSLQEANEADPEVEYVRYRVVGSPLL